MSISPDNLSADELCPVQGRFQDFFQGVAEMSSGSGENLPGGGEKIARSPPFSVFCFFTQHFSFTPTFFYILDTRCKEIHKIYFLKFVLFIFYLLYASLVSRRGAETP